MTQSLMIDLETWGTRPGCALRSIGAAWFDPVTFDVGETFLVNVTRDDQVAAGLHIDPQTFAWWAGQSVEAQAALEVEPVDAVTAFMRLQDWVRSDPEHSNAEVWAWGARFDFPILEAAMERVTAGGLTLPWTHRQERCARTACAMVDVRPGHAEGLVHHNALHDCRAQITALRAARTALAAGAVSLAIADGETRHNKAMRPLLAHMVELAGTDHAHLNVLTESLLIGVGMINFPGEPAKQAAIIEEITHGAIDRVASLGASA